MHPHHACRKRDGTKADLLDYGMPTKRKGGATGASVLDLDTAGNYRPRTKVGRPCQHTSSHPVTQRMVADLPLLSCICGLQQPCSSVHPVCPCCMHAPHTHASP